MSTPIQHNPAERGWHPLRRRHPVTAKPQPRIATPEERQLHLAVNSDMDALITQRKRRQEQAELRERVRRAMVKSKRRK